VTDWLSKDASERAAPILQALGTYRSARRALLEAIGCASSNRDPLAELSERLVAALLGAELAQSRVQRGYDMTTGDGNRVQVRYLANPPVQWVNEHVVDFRGDCDRYALVVFVAFEIVAVLIFRKETIGRVCAALGKRHRDQDQTLQFGKRNLGQLLAMPDRGASLGVDIWTPLQG